MSDTLSYEAIRGCSTNFLMEEVMRLGHDGADVLTAKIDALAGIVYASQFYNEETLDRLQEYGAVVRVRKQDQAIAAKPEKKKRERSAVGGAVARVHEICRANADKPRAEIIALCVEAGINKNTAATQYAKWNRDRKG